MEGQRSQLSTAERNRIRQEESKKISELGPIVAVTLASLQLFSDFERLDDNFKEKRDCAIITRNAFLKYFSNGNASRDELIRLFYVQTRKHCQDVSKKLNPTGDEEIYQKRKGILIQKITESELAEKDIAISVADLMLGRSDILNISHFELVEEFNKKDLSKNTSNP